MANVDFKETAKKVVELIGGNENISNVTHCITRVRFMLKDEEKALANAQAIKDLPGVMETINAGGQFQVVIGPAVEKMYNEVVELTGKAGGEVDADPQDTEKTKFGFSSIIKVMSGVIMPAMPAMIGCGIAASLFNLFNMLGWLNQESGFGMVMYGIGQACTYFMPVIIGGFAAKYFKIDHAIGNVVGAALMYPTFAAAAGTTTNLFGLIPLTFKDYSSSVFPVIVAVLFASWINKLLKKVIPDVLKTALVPFFTLLVTVPVSLLIIAPVMDMISNALSAGLMAIYNFAPVLAALILGGSWLLFIVPLGLHMGLAMLFYSNYFVMGYDPMLGLLSGIMTLSGTLLAVALKTKNEDTKSMAVTSAVSNALGISEPGLYGVILQHKETIITSAIAGALSNLFAAFFHTNFYTFGFSGIFALPSYISPDGSMSSLIGAILTNVSGFALAFILTYLWKFDVDKKKA